MTSNPTTTAFVKRACDSCHRRKIKCIAEGTAPCKNCISAGFSCTYNNIPQKKGPKGSRANVLSEIRETQLAAGFPTDLSFDRRPLSLTFARTQDLLPPGLIESCTRCFFTYLYHLEPVLSWERVQEATFGMERSTEAYCMIVALCAYVMIRASYKPPASVLLQSELARMSNIDIGCILLKESVRVRQSYEYRENPTHMSVLTSWLYSGCYLGLAREDMAWTYLRDATTQAQLLGMQDEETYKQDPLDTSRKRVLYWLLFIAERTHALHKHRPISLYPTIHPPSLGEIPSNQPIAVSLGIMVDMFKIIDSTFINLWNGVQKSHATAAWITEVQTQLLEVVPTHIECTEAQEVQIRIAQHWLRLQIWQLGVRQGLVSSISSDDSLTFNHPIEMAGDFLENLNHFSQQAMEIHGIMLVEKLFDIACCLIDVVSCTSSLLEPFASSSLDCVSYILIFISRLHEGQSRYLPLLQVKLSEVLPDFPAPRSLNLLQTIPTSTVDLHASDSRTLYSDVADNSSRNRAATLSSCPFR